MYDLPRETFRRHTTGELKGYYGHLLGGKDTPKILSPDQENELAGHVGKFAQAGFPFTPSEIRDLAYEYADLNGVEGFNKMKKRAGHQWLQGFLKCHKELSIKTPKLLSVYCAKSANLEVLNNWFDLYKEVLEENNIAGPLYIWNVNECRCIDSPKPCKVVAVRMLRPNQLGPTEKGQTTTSVVFVNAAGMHTRPIVIHKGLLVQEEWKKDMPRNYMIGASENGWITKKLFYLYGKCLIEYITEWDLCDDGQKHLLLMDSHIIATCLTTSS